MFCVTLEPNHYEFIKELGYIPVGLGDKNFNNNWLSDKLGDNKDDWKWGYLHFKSRFLCHPIKCSILKQLITHGTKFP